MTDIKFNLQERLDRIKQEKIAAEHLKTIFGVEGTEGDLI